MKKTLLSKLSLFIVATLTLAGCGDEGNKNPGTDPNIPAEPEEPVDPVDTTYSFTFNGIHCTANNLNEYEKDSQVSITITPDYDCVLPEDVSVTGVDKYQFSKETGVLSFTITNDVVVTCTCTVNEYKTISFNLEHMTAQCGERYIVNSEVTATLIPDEGYSLPSQEGISLTNATLISYSELSGALTFKVLGDVTIEAAAVYAPVAARVLTDFEHCSISYSKQYNVGDDYSEIITPDSGYKLPDSIVITGLAEGYTYDKATGVVTGVIESSTVTIKCVAEELYYSFKFSGKYCTATYLNQYRANEQVSIKITPNSGYEFGDMLSVTGVDDYDFSKETGILSFVMTNDVTVSCECKNMTLYYISYNLEHMNVEADNGFFLNSYVSLTFIPEDGYKVPDKNDYEITNAEVISYRVGYGDENDPVIGYMVIVIKGNVTITAAAERVECEVDAVTEVENVTITGLKDKYYKNEILTGTIVPNKQYILPAQITLEGDSILKSYSSTTGEFEIVLNTECIINAVGIYSPVPVSITPILTNCTISQSKTYNVYDTYSEIITPNKNYLLPKSIASDKVEGLSGWAYDAKTGEIKGEIIGDVSITVACAADESKVATYEFNGEHCSSTDAGSLFVGDDFSIKISPDSDYKLPESISVSGLMPGFTYNKSSGDVKGVVFANSVRITCVAEEIIDIVSFTFTGIHCSTTALAQYEEKTVIELDITPDFAYKLPESYTATGLENITYNSATGKFIATIVANATLEIEATKITDQYAYTVTATNCKENPSGIAVYGEKVEVTVVPNAAYSLPLTLTSSSGCKDVEYNPTTGKISFVVLGVVSINLSAIYTPKEFSFSYSGSHVSCNHKSVIYEADEFSCTLVPDEDYLLPENITVTGLADGYSYNPEDGSVSGIIVGNVSITCDCVYDTSNKALLVLNCTNCSVTNPPQYVAKDSTVTIAVNCDFGYSLTVSSISVISGVISYNVYSNVLYIETGFADTVEINITAIEDIQSIDFSSEHCNATITAGDTISGVGVARFIVDEGYILPELNQISTTGIEVLTYNTDTQVMTFRRIEEEASISVTAIEGQKSYTSTISQKAAEKLIFPDGTYEDLFNSFIDCSLVEIRNAVMHGYDQSEDVFADSTNDVVHVKNDYNLSSYNSNKINFYGVLDDIYTNQYLGTIYVNKGDSWKAYDANSGYGPDNHYISHIAESPLFAFSDGNPFYDETNRCYTIVEDSMPYNLFFKDGKLLGVLVSMMGYFNYCEFSDYGTTTVTLPEFPTFYKVHASVDNGCYITGYETYDLRYQYGDKIELFFGAYGGYEVGSVNVISGLENWTFVPGRQGILRGTVTGDVEVSVFSTVMQ